MQALRTTTGRRAKSAAVCTALTLGLAISHAVPNAGAAPHKVRCGSFITISNRVVVYATNMTCAESLSIEKRLWRAAGTVRSFQRDGKTYYRVPGNPGWACRGIGRAAVKGTCVKGTKVSGYALRLVR